MVLAAHRWRRGLRSSLSMPCVRPTRPQERLRGWLWCLPPHTNAERARLPAPAKERRWSDARRPLAEACPPPRWAALLLRVSAGGPWQKALVCFPPSLDLMARKDRVPHGVPGRPTAREAEVGGARTWALLSGLALPRAICGQLPRREATARDRTAAPTRPLGRPAEVLRCPDSARTLIPLQRLCQ